MKDLITLDDSNKPVTSSLKIAEVFGKQHAHVMRDIKKLIEKDVSNFGEISICDSYNRLQPAYQIDRDGFTLLVMGFTGDKALKFKMNYTKAFNAMEEKLKESQPKTQLEVLPTIRKTGQETYCSEGIQDTRLKNELNEAIDRVFEIVRKITETITP